MPIETTAPVASTPKFVLVTTYGNLEMRSAPMEAHALIAPTTQMLRDGVTFRVDRALTR
jgi:hypothetical protein